MMKQPRASADIPTRETKREFDSRILSVGHETPVKLVALDLGRLITGMRNELRRLLREDIVFDISPLTSGRCIVHGDRDEMRELVIHLVLDARDAMPRGGSLDLTVTKAPIREAGTRLAASTEYVVVTVRERPAPKGTTDPQEARLQVVKGRALSLGASYDAIERFGGQLKVSRHVQETSVRIYFPSLGDNLLTQA